MRVLVFADPKVESIVETLSVFASVKQVNYEYTSLSGRTQHLFFKVPYRTIEGLLWILRVFKETRRFRANLVIAQYAYFSGLIGAIAAMLSRREFVVRVIGSDLKISTRLPIGAAVVRFALRMASGVICVSRDIEDIAKKFGARNTIVIPPSLPPQDYNQTNLRRRENEIITVARLVPIKGMSFLVKAMTDIENGKLVIIGDGPERKELRLLSLNLGLSDRVFFTRWIKDRSKLLNRLNQATLFVLPSLSEGLPRAIIEAMACGLPIVATNVGGIPELVLDGINGFLVPPANEKVLAQAINRVLKDADFRKIASEKNREIAKKYLLPVVSKKICKFLKQICSA